MGTEAEKPAKPKPGGLKEGRAMLLADAIGPIPSFRLETLDRLARLLERARDESAHGVLLPAHLVHDLGNRDAALALHQGDHLRHLAALARGTGGVLCLSGILGFGRGLGGGGLLGRLPLRGRNVGGLCATFGLRGRLRLGGLRGCGLRGRLFGLSDLAQIPDALPNARGGDVAGLEAFHPRADARKAVEGSYQALGGPSGEQVCQLLPVALCYLIAHAASSNGCITWRIPSSVWRNRNAMRKALLPGPPRPSIPAKARLATPGRT
jgi:hypothetical protein